MQGSMVGLLVGACVVAGLAFALIRVRRRWKASAALKEATEISALAHAQRFEARNGRWIGVVAMLALGAVVVALGANAYIAFQHGALAYGSLLAVLAVPMLAWAITVVPRVLGNRPTLAMDARGLEFDNLERRIAWPEIVAITWWTHTVKNRQVNMLRILVRKPVRYLEGASWMLRLVKFRWRSQQPRYGHFDLPMDHLDKTPAVVHAAAMQFRERTTPPLITLWQAGMDDRQIDALVNLAGKQADVEAAVRSTDPSHLDAIDAQMAELDRETEAALMQASTFAKRSQRKQWIWNAIVFGLVIVGLVLKATH